MDDKSCKGYWLDRDNLSLDKIKCCLDLCSDHILFCKKRCKKNDCYICDGLERDCENGCFEPISKNQKSFNSCVEKKADKNYLIENKDKIISCCEKNCEKDKDCISNFCKDYHGYLTNIKHVDTIFSPIKKKVVRTDKLLYIFFILINIIIIILLLLYKK